MPAKKILIFAPYGSWMVHHQLDAVLGAGLAARGCDVLVLACDGVLKDCIIAGNPRNDATCANCAHAGASLFSSMGLKTLQLGKAATREDHDAAAVAVEAFPGGSLNDLRYGGYPLGEWSLASMQGYFSTGNLDLGNGKILGPMKSQLGNGVLLIRVLARLLDEFRPDQIFCYNALHYYYRIAFELGRERKIPVLVHERGLLNDGFSLVDSEGINSNQGRFRGWEPWKNVPLTLAECKEIKAYFRDREEGKNSFSRFYDFKGGEGDIRRSLRIPRGGRIVAMFPSGDREIGAFEDAGTKTFASQLDWIEATAAICQKHDLYLVIRHHPSNVQKNLVNLPFLGKVLALSRRLPDRVRVIMPHEKITSYALAWASDLSLTYFSTMGSETLVRGVAGVCVGNSLYRPMGVEWVESPADYEKAILAGLERTRGFGIAELRQAYRFAHFLVCKLAYKFQAFGIKDTYAPDIRVRNVAELMPGKDPVFDRVCDHVVRGTPLYPVPDAAERDRSGSEESAFLEEELAELQVRRGKAAQGAAPSPQGDPVFTVLAPEPKPGLSGAWRISLERSREKSIQVLHVPWKEDFAGMLAVLREALDSAKGRYVYLAQNGIDLDESVFSASADLLDAEANSEAKAVVWGAWLAGETGDLTGELFTENRPAKDFESVLQACPDLEDPIRFLSLQIMRTDFLRELIGWLEAMSGFDTREISASLFGFFHGPKSEGASLRFEIPMMVVRPVTVPAPSSQERNVPTDTGKSPQQIEAELNVQAQALARNPGDKDTAIGCILSLAALGDGFNARRIISLYLQVHPGDAEVRKLSDDVEWLSRKGTASLAEWKLRGAGYDRLRTGRPFATYAEAEPYVHSVPGWMLEGQEKFLFDKVKSLPDGAVILEMGADRGRSTSAMALACVGTRKRVFSIDTFAGNAGLMGKNDDYYGEWRGNLERLGLGDYVTGLQGYTFDVLPAWDRPVDFTFIDASHEYIDVLNDLRLIFPFVKKDGWIAFHDVEPGWPGPWRVWLEYGIPLLTDHEVVHTLACGRKSRMSDFGKRPESIPEFSFSGCLARESQRSSDPALTALAPSLAASLGYRTADARGRQNALAAEAAIAKMPSQFRQTLFSMISKDAYLDGYLHYWFGLALEAEGNPSGAMKEFATAARVSYPVPLDQLRRGVSPFIPPAPNLASEIFRPHIAAGDTVVELGSGDGALLSELPGGLKLGLETDDQLRKVSSLTAGIDAFNEVSELPEGLADVVIGHASLARARNPLAMLQSLRDRLKPAGKIVFTTPAAAQGSPEAEDASLFSWTPATFRNLFTAAGFAVREVGTAEAAGSGGLIKLVADRTRSGSPNRDGRDWAMVNASSPAIIADAAKPDPRDIPVALVAYRRPAHTRKVLESLERHGVRNLYVFCDGAKGNGDEADVKETLKLVQSIGWVRPEIHRVDANRGLAKSVMAAADHVLSKHETVVLLEDDCVPHRHFFDFMASTLGKYRDEEKVYGVSGYTVPINPELLRRYPHDVYFCPRISSWGWATWRRAWKQLDRDLISACRKALDAKIDLDQGGNDIKHSIEGMLQGHVKDVWTLPWVLSVYVNRGCFAYPTVSHIDNIGMDGTGVHCGKTDKYLTNLAETPATRFPDRPYLDPEMIARFRSFYDLSLQKA